MMRSENNCSIILIVVSKSFPSKEWKFTFWIWFIRSFNAIDRVRFFFIFCCICIDLFSRVQHKHTFIGSTKSNCVHQTPSKWHNLIRFMYSFIIFCRIGACFFFIQRHQRKSIGVNYLSFYSAFAETTLNAKRKIHNEWGILTYCRVNTLVQIECRQFIHLHHKSVFHIRNGLKHLFFHHVQHIHHRTMKILKLISKWVGFFCYSVAVLFSIYFFQVIVSSNNHKSTLVSQTNQKKEQKTE